MTLKIFLVQCLAGQEILVLTVELGVCQTANGDENGSVLIC